MSSMTHALTLTDWISRHFTPLDRRAACLLLLASRVPDVGDKFAKSGALEAGGDIDWECLGRNAYLSSTESLLTKIVEGIWLEREVCINFRVLALLDDRQFALAVELLCISRGLPVEEFARTAPGTGRP